jgi:hypothetical protein
MDVERRLSERVQFFQQPGDDVAVPVWVFNHAKSDTILGLLLDVSDEGVQIMTDEAVPPLSDEFQLIVQTDETANINLAVATMHKLWSKSDGTPYVRHGFSFDGDINLTMLLDCVFAARDSGRQWLRCGLIASTRRDH